MYEHKIIKANDSAIKILEKENWELCTIYQDKMYFKKQIKQKHNITIDKETPEWLEFIKLYRTINNKWSYAETLIKKYHECLKEKPHADMMDKLKEYKQHLELFTKKPPLQVWTYLNQKRYNDTYEVTKVNYATKRRDDMLKEQKIDKMYIEQIMLEASKWDSNHGKTSEMTVWIFQNIINKITW